MDGDGSEMKGYPVSGVMVEEKAAVFVYLNGWQLRTSKVCVFTELCVKIQKCEVY